MGGEDIIRFYIERASERSNLLEYFPKRYKRVYSADTNVG